MKMRTHTPTTTPAGSAGFSGPADLAPDPVVRRQDLTGRPNPAGGRDVLLGVSAALDLCQPPGLPAPWVALRYVPDRLVLDESGFRRYLVALGRWRWTGVDDLALAILDDVNNQAVPRWVRVTVAARQGAPYAPSDAPPDFLKVSGDWSGPWAVIEDRQPRWRGPVPGA